MPSGERFCGVVNDMSLEYAEYLTVEAQGTLFKVSKQSKHATLLQSDSTRGEITYFSDKSRKRLLEKFARLDVDAKTTSFLTLTYGADYPDATRVKEHLRAFVERLRRAYPCMSAIWRLEYQKRGAPHFHLILLNAPYIGKEWIADSWSEIVGHRARTRIERPKNQKRAFAYVAKYAAKNTEKFAYVEAGDMRQGLYSLETGEVVHGVVETTRLDGTKVLVSEAGEYFEVELGVFIFVPYLHAGRYWGVFNKHYLPWAELLKMRLSDYAEAAYFMTRFEIRKYIYQKLHMSRKWQGFSVFCKNPDSLYRLFRLNIIRSYELGVSA